MPKALRYLLDEPIRQVLFFLLVPERQRALEASGRDKGLPVRLSKKEVRLHRDWRWRLIAAGCDAAEAALLLLSAVDQAAAQRLLEPAGDLRLPEIALQESDPFDRLHRQQVQRHDGPVERACRGTAG